MKLWSWYAHAWYFSPDVVWCDEIELSFDLRQWLVGVSFAGRYYWLQLGPIHLSYRAGL